MASTRSFTLSLGGQYRNLKAAVALETFLELVPENESRIVIPKIRNICETTIARCHTTNGSQLTHDSRTCTKRLFSLIKEKAKLKNGIPPVSMHENSYILAGKDLANAEILSKFQ